MDVIWSQRCCILPQHFWWAELASLRLLSERRSPQMLLDKTWSLYICYLCMWFEYQDQLSTLKMSKEHWLCGKSLDWWQLIESFKSSNPSDFTMRLKIRWAETQRIGWCGIEVCWCLGFSKAEPILDHAMCFATCGDLNTAFVGWWFWMYFSAEGQNGNSKYHNGALLEVCGILWKNHGIGLHINW